VIRYARGVFPPQPIEQSALDQRASNQEGPAVEAEVRNDREVIDQALQLVYAQYETLARQLSPRLVRDVDMDELREGRFGQDLLRLSLMAHGRVREDKEHVLEAIESVLELLFYPIGADEYSVPRSFWDTELGRILAQAKYRAYEPSELISIGNAAQALGVTRPTIYRWMDERRMDYVRDEMSGRTFVVRKDIENLKRVESELGAL
jgi:excisionase family DNA binding protein